MTVPLKSGGGRFARPLGRHNVVFVAEQDGALCDAARVFAVVGRLLLAEGVTFQSATGGRFDAAYAAPPIAEFGVEQTHLGFRMMDSAAVAEDHF
jgi:hypothetical protein